MLSHFRSTQEVQPELLANELLTSGQVLCPDIAYSLCSLLVLSVVVGVSIVIYTACSTVSRKAGIPLYTGEGILLNIWLVHLPCIFCQATCRGVAMPTRDCHRVFLVFIFVVIPWNGT